MLALFVAVIASVATFTNKVMAAPTTFTVTNTNDSGEGSLRQAIIDANSNGNSSDMDVIEFDIPGDQVHTIELDTELPSISQKVTINGYSQTGAQENSAPNPQPFNAVIKIEVKGNQDIFRGFYLEPSAPGSIIKGLSVYGFNKYAVIVYADDLKIQGNYLNVKADGLSLADYQTEIAVGNREDVGSAEDVLIGGTSPNERNVINATGGGDGLVAITGNAIFYGNYMGLGADGHKDLGCNLGVGLPGEGSILGGPNMSQRNVIAGCDTVNVIVTGNNNTVQGNYIGTNYKGEVDEGIGQGAGVILTGMAAENLIGGNNSGEGNTLKDLSGVAIGIQHMKITGYGLDLMPAKNSFLGNDIGSVDVFEYPGFGDSNQGIDHYISIDNSETPDFQFEVFEQRGPTANDEGDADTGGNGLINFPVLKKAQQVGNQLTVTYDLDAADSPSNTYRIELFASDERSIFGYGPGETYLGAIEASANGEDLEATITVSGEHAGKALSATATAIDNTTSSGFGATSEFSKNVSIGSTIDYDADGVADLIENGAPNNGDGNYDGIPDRLQPTTTSFLAANSYTYTTLITEGCSENGRVSSLNASSLATKDNGYEYPYGLSDFTLYCSRGDTVNVTMYVHENSEPEKYLPRKYNPATKTFNDIPGSVLGTQQLGESSALKLTYSIKDGGDLDDDGEENGIIVDPVGLAREGHGVLANTGIVTVLGVPVGVLLIAGAVYTYLDYRKHKRPLTQDDPYLASSYTYVHHLKVVALPMAMYRLNNAAKPRQAYNSPRLPY